MGKEPKIILNDITSYIATGNDGVLGKWYYGIQTIPT